MTQLSHKVGHVPIQFLSSYTYKRLGLSSQQGIHTHTHTHSFTILQYLIFQGHVITMLKNCWGPYCGSLGYELLISRFRDGWSLGRILWWP